MKIISASLVAFLSDEDGAALTEYIVLLGILTAGIIAAINLFGVNATALWSSWAVWILGVTPAPT